MRRFFRNKFFIVTLCVALLVALSGTVLAVMGVSNPFGSLFTTLSTPFRWCAGKIAGGLEGYKVYFNKIEKIADENAVLENENAELRKKLAEAERKAQHDEYLRRYLDLPWLKSEYKLADATVISRESSGYKTVYTLNRGSLHGIKKGMPVITDKGTVGSVSEVGLNFCKVDCLLETSSAVGVYVKRSGASGLLVGDLKFRNSGLCVITYIDAGADIKKGDLVVTAGTGSIYPSELIVGDIVDIVPDEYSRTLRAVVRPAADFENLKEVMILTEYTIKAYGYDDIDPTQVPAENTGNEEKAEKQKAAAETE